MIRICLIAFNLMAYLFCAAQPSGRNVLHGQITMPPVSKRPAIKRGNAYRNRGAEVVNESKRQAEQTNLPNNNVVVALYPLEFKPMLPPSKDAYLLQKEKTFIPNILPVTKGSTVIIENADDFYHNVFSITPGARFNIGRRPPQNRRYQQINQSGEIKLFCDIHPQMNATILSLETPYFVRADLQGHYRLENLPDGLYTLSVFHPNFGWKHTSIKVLGDEVKRQDFELSETSEIKFIRKVN